MTKRRGSRANKKKHKQVITLAGGETAPQRPTGLDRWHTHQDPDPPGKVMEARVRQTGLPLEEVKGQIMGCAVGRRLRLDHINDRDELFEAVQHMRRVTVAYDRAVGSPKRHAQCLRIMTPPERFEADAASPAPDMRSDEERDRQAVAAWTTLQGWLLMADYRARVACKSAVLDEPDLPIADWSGVVLALRCVADGMKGRKMVDRRRG